MPFPNILSDLGGLGVHGFGLGRMKPNGATPPFVGGNPGKLAQPPQPSPAPAQQMDAPDTGWRQATPADSGQPDGSGMAPAAPNRPTDMGSMSVDDMLKSPYLYMTPGERAAAAKMQEPVQNATGIRKVFGSIVGTIAQDPRWQMLQGPANALQHPGLNQRNQQIQSDMDLGALQRQAVERAAQLQNTAENQRYLHDLRQQNLDLQNQNSFARQMGDITKAGGFEAPNIPPEIQSQSLPMSPQLTQIPGSGPQDQPSNTDLVKNLPQKSPLLIPGMTPQQSSSLGTVQTLKDPSTGEVRNMVRPNLRTQAEMKQVDAPQDILDFYKNLPADFTKQYPVTPPTVPANGKISPEEAKRLETKYQRDSAALQAWNTNRQKPASAAQNKEQFQTTMAKIAAAGLPAGAITNVNQQVSAIRSAAQRGVISPDEANSAIGYLAANTTPAAQGSNTTIRVEGMANMRMSQVLDTKNGNAPVLMNANEINEANRNEPGRYIPASSGTKALNQTALLEDIRGSINQTRESLAKVPEFSMADKAKIAVAMRDRDPRSAVAQLIGSAAGSSMTPDQQEYLINLAQLHEQAMAMRSVLGAGQSSEDLRAAIMRTIPGPGTPNKAYAAKQLDAFEKTLNRLSRGVPQVPLRTDNGAPKTFDVADPTGTVHHFPSQQAADAFKKAAGIQ